MMARSPQEPASGGEEEAWPSITTSRPPCSAGRLKAPAGMNSLHCGGSPSERVDRRNPPADAHADGTVRPRDSCALRTAVLSRATGRSAPRAGPPYDQGRRYPQTGGRPPERAPSLSGTAGLVSRVRRRERARPRTVHRRSDHSGQPVAACGANARGAACPVLAKGSSGELVGDVPAARRSGRVHGRARVGERDRGSQYSSGAEAGGVPGFRAARRDRSAHLRQCRRYQGSADLHPGSRVRPSLVGRERALGHKRGGAPATGTSVSCSARRSTVRSKGSQTSSGHTDVPRRRQCPDGGEAQVLRVRHRSGVLDLAGPGAWAGCRVQHRFRSRGAPPWRRWRSPDRMQASEC